MVTKRKEPRSYSSSTGLPSKRNRSNTTTSTTAPQPGSGNLAAKSSAMASSPAPKYKQTSSHSASSSTIDRDIPMAISSNRALFKPQIITSGDGHSYIEDPYRASTASFPYFPSGRVYIHLSSDEQVDFQLHGVVLARNSPWFERQLGPEREQAVYHFVLVPNLKKGFPVLVRKICEPLKEEGRAVISYSKTSTSLVVNITLTPTAAANSKADITAKDPRAMVMAIKDFVSSFTTDVEQGAEKQPKVVQLASGHGNTIKAENHDQDLIPGLYNSPSEADPSREELHKQYITAYESLLTMFYKAPSRLTNYIDCLLDKCEKIVLLAEHYDCLPAVGLYLSNALLQFCAGLYLSISKDPPRWLKLATSLESKPIYSEAMTHCAGCYPFSLLATPSSALMSNVLERVREKSEWLSGLRTNITVELLINSIEEVASGPLVAMTESPTVWLVVQIFRDWLSSQLRELRDTKKIHDGTLYRLMSLGGDAYLPSAQVGELIPGPKVVDDHGILDLESTLVDFCLEIMKDFAKDAVKQLMVNHLMIDPVMEKISYLTCVEVGADEFPWK